MPTTHRHGLHAGGARRRGGFAPALVAGRAREGCAAGSTCANGARQPSATSATLGRRTGRPSRRGAARRRPARRRWSRGRRLGTRGALAVFPLRARSPAGAHGLGRSCARGGARARSRDPASRAGEEIAPGLRGRAPSTRAPGAVLVAARRAPLVGLQRRARAAGHTRRRGRTIAAAIREGIGGHRRASRGVGARASGSN